MTKFKHGDYEILAETWETKNNWGHKAMLYKGDEFITQYKATYYNRTWESYQYRSVVIGVLSKYMNDRAETLFLRYKAKNNKNRLTQDVKSAIMKGDDIIQDIKSWLKEL